jgi:hypothetical protein
MNRVLTLAGIGVAAYVVWAAARVGAGARKRPRSTFIPYIDNRHPASWLRP